MASSSGGGRRRSRSICSIDPVISGASAATRPR